MKITLENTTKIVELRLPGGATVPARIWEGQTESGIPVFAYVTRIAPRVKNPGPEITGPFEAELTDCRAPSPEVDAIPPRLIL